MKKVLTLLLSLCILWSFAPAVTATGVNTSGVNSITALQVKVKYDTKSDNIPKENLKFLVEDVGEVQFGGEGAVHPSLSIKEIQTQAGEKEYTTTFEEANFEKIGVYKYKITLIAPDKKAAGVTYDASTKYLQVQVTYTTEGNLDYKYIVADNESFQNKSSEIEFVNKYTTADLAIQHKVEGNLGDREKYFDIEVSLSGDDDLAYDALEVSGGSNDGNAKEIAVGTPQTFKLKHGDTLTIKNLPAGVQYTISSPQKPDNYEFTVSPQESGVISADEQNVKLTATHKLEQALDTGLILDNLPYLIILGLAVLGFILFFSRKKKVEE